MDMGLCLNGVRDDQVSVFNTAIFPDAMLIIGGEDNKFTIKDVVVLTRDIPKMNVFK